MICPHCKTATKTNYASHKPFEYCVKCKIEVFTSINDNPPVFLPMGSSDKDLEALKEEALRRALDNFGHSDPFKFIFLDDVDDLDYDVDSSADLGDD